MAVPTSLCSNPWTLVVVLGLCLLLDRFCGVTERLCCAIIKAVLSRIILEGSSLKVIGSFWEGALEIQGLRLKQEVIDGFDLPFSCISASIERIRIQLSWLHNHTSPISLTISGAALYTRTRRNPQAVNFRAHKQDVEKLRRQQRSSRLRAIENILWGTKEKSGKKAKMSIARHLAFIVARFVAIDIADWSLEILLDYAVDPPASHGGRSEALQHERIAGVGSTTVIHLRTLQVLGNQLGSSGVLAVPAGYGVLSTGMAMRGLSVIMRPPSNGQQAEPLTVIKGWHISTRLQWRLASGFLDRLGADQTPSAPVVRIQISPAALTVRLDAAAVMIALGLSASFLHFYRFYGYRKLRPQEPVDVAPISWWQHAGMAVLREARQVTGREGCKRQHTFHRQHLRQRYQMIYLEHRSSTFWQRMQRRMSGITCGTRREMKRIESGLSTLDIALLRWRAWAEFSEQDAEAMHSTLESVYQILLAKGTLRQKRSRPFRAHIEAYSPRAALVLPGPVVNGQRLPLCTVSLTQLSCKVLAGSQTSRQLHSGSGAVFTQASCAGFSIIDDFQLEQQRRSGITPALDTEQSLPWLVKSPAHSSSDETQAFFDFHYHQPALRAASPSMLLVNMAPIDVIYNQGCLLNLFAYLDASWPPRSLDPLAVQSAITLPEIVKESLTAQNLQPATQQRGPEAKLQVEIGDVRMLLPLREEDSVGALERSRRGHSLSEMPDSPDGSEAPAFFVVVIGGFSIGSAERRPGARSRTTTSDAGGRDNMRRASMERPFAAARPLEERRGHTVRTYSMTEADLQQKFAAVSSQARRRNEALFRTAHGDLGSAWMASSTSVSSLAMLQIQFNLQAFLARPSEQGAFSPEDCTTVVSPLSVDAFVEHGLEPSTDIEFRRLVQVSLSSSPIELQISQGIKQQLSTMMLYLARFDSKKVAELSQRFSQPDRDADASRRSSRTTKKSSGHSRVGSRNSLADSHSSPMTRQMSGLPTSRLSKDMTGSRLGRSATSHDRSAAGHDTDTSRSDGKAQTVSSEVDEDEKRNEDAYSAAGYGFSMLMQLQAPAVTLQLIREGISEDDPALALFTLRLTEIQCSLASEQEVDVRIGLKSFGLFDEAQSPAHRAVLVPAPEIVSRKCLSARSTLRQAFVTWRHQIAAQTSIRRRARDTLGHFYCHPASQICCHIVSGTEKVLITVDGSVLAARLELATLRHAAQSAGDLIQNPTPTEAANSGALSDVVVAAAAAAEEGKDHARKGKSVAAKYSEFFNHEQGGSGKRDNTALDKERHLQQTASAVPASAFTAKSVPKKSRRVIIQTMWRAMHATVAIDQKPLLSAMADNFEAAIEVSPEDIESKELSVQCSSVVLLDCSCGLPMYRAAMVIEPSLCDDFAIRTTIQRSRVYYPSSAYQQGSGDQTAEAGNQSPTRHSEGQAPGRPASSGKSSLKPPKVQALMQKVARTEIDHMQLILVSRFIYDILYFCDQVKTSLSLFSQGQQPEPSADANAAKKAHYRPLREVKVHNVSIMIPRDSWSPEHLIIYSPQLRVLMPITAACLAGLRPDLNRSVSPTHARRASFAVHTSKVSWQDELNAMSARQHNHEEYFGREHSGLSLDPDDFADDWHDADGNFHNQFHHWWTGQHAGMAVQLKSMRMVWGLQSEQQAVRQIWDGDDLLVSVPPDLTHFKAWCSWVKAIYGELQHHLLMAIMYSNMCEPSNFGPPAPPPAAVGAFVPAAKSQPKRLGLDASMPVAWDLEVNVRSVSFAAELLPGPHAAPGIGPPVAQLHVQDLNTKLACYNPWALQITNCCKSLLLLDTRETEGQTAESSEVIAIQKHLLTQIGLPEATPAGHWQHLRSAVRHNIGPFAPPHQLARHSHLTSRGNPLSEPASPSHRGTGFRPGGVPRKASFGAEAVQYSPRRLTGSVEAPAGLDENLDGFYMVYTIHPAEVAENSQLTSGPHVVEVVASGVQLQWSQMLQLDLIWQLSQVYSSYTYSPWVSPYREAPGLQGKQWMYCNVIMRNSQLLIPVPDAFKHSAAPSDPKGLLFQWASLRLGYFFGGDSECLFRVNADKLAAVAQLPGSQDPQDFLVPLQAIIDTSWHQPARRRTPSTMSLRVTLSDLHLQPSFGHVPMLQALLDQGRMSAAKRNDELQVIQQEMAAQGWDTGQAQAATFQPFIWKIDISTDTIAVGLVDDRYGHHILVLVAKIQELKLQCRKQHLRGHQPCAHSSASAAVEVAFLNSAMDAIEPIVEGWPVSLDYVHSADTRRFNITSSKRLNVVITPAAFRSIGDLRSFIILMNKPASNGTSGLSGVPARIMHRWLEGTRGKMSTLYRLVNQTGLRLSYWVEQGGIKGDPYSVDARAESAVMVSPIEKTVILSDSQQQIRARVISMQFEGNWSTIQDVIVDKVGKYAYINGSTHDNTTTPIIMDVSLDIRTKVLTLHSPVRVENRTSVPLDFMLQISRSSFPQGGNQHGTASTTMPASGPLIPNAACYLPMPAMWGGIMYLHAIGWQLGKKDKIAIEPAALKEKQGLYSCPPIGDSKIGSTPLRQSAGSQKHPFHCCLKVTEEPIKAQMGANDSLAAHPEHCLAFYPPIIIHNVLPFEVEVFLQDHSNATDLERQSWIIPRGESQEVYNFDMVRKLKMHVHLKGYASVRPAAIHYPPSGYLDDSTRRSALADMPGLRLDKEIALIKSNVRYTTQRLWQASERLSLRLQNKVDAGSRAREVTMYCPYWIINKTNEILQIQDTGHTSAPAKARPGLSTPTEPILFSTPRGQMRLCIDPAHWSRTLNLESLGINASTWVLGPARVPGPALNELLEDGVVAVEIRDGISPRNLAQRRHATASTGLLPRDSGLETSSDVELDTTPSPPSPKRVSAFQTDPGHMLAKLNCAGGPATATESADQTRYEFSVEVALAPTIFSATKVVTISSRYVIFNNSPEYLQFGQRNANLAWQLAPGSRMPFHWDDATGKPEMCLRPAAGSWNWSGAFAIEAAADMGVRMYNPSMNVYRIYTAEISNHGGAFLITVGKESDRAPYRIENRCEGAVVKFVQRDVEGEGWQALEPGQSTDYAWDEPLGSNRLRVMVREGRRLADVENDMLNLRPNINEYQLDMIKAYPVIKVRKSNQKMVAKMASAVRSAGALAGRTASASYARDQPDLDARHVYVSVHADGPTRVLCFSESKDRYTKGAGDESLGQLSKKLERLDVRIKDVDHQLQEIDERQNLDLSLAMGDHGDAEFCKEIADQILLDRQVSGTTPLSRAVSNSVASSGGSEAVQASPGSMSRMTMFAPRASMVGPIGRTSIVPADLLPAPQEEAPEEPPVHTPSRVKRMFRSSMEHMKKVNFGLRSGSLTRSDKHDNTPRATYEDDASENPSIHSSNSRVAALLGNTGQPSPSLTWSSSFPEPALQGDLSQVAQETQGERMRLPPLISQGSPATPESTVPATWAEAPPSELSSSPDPPLQPSSVGPDGQMQSPGGRPGAGRAFPVHQASPFSSSALERLQSVSSEMYSPPPIAYPSRMAPAPEFRPSVIQQMSPSAVRTGTASPRPSSPQPRPILGGELIVRVVCAKGLSDAWRRGHRHVQDLFNKKYLMSKKSASRALRQETRVGRSEVYAVLKCEDQERRTGPAMGLKHPDWKEEVSFRNISASSDIQVTVYGRQKLGHDVFLGEVVVPLRDVSELHADRADPRKFTLGRRSTKEKVSGEIHLAMGWRITPAVELVMKLKSKQSEVERKEEILAQLHERYSAAKPANPSVRSGKHKAETDATEKPRRLDASRGSLEVKVLEARNIAAPNDLLRAFKSINAFVILSVSTEAGLTSQQTHIQRNTLEPRWNEQLTFKDISAADSIRLALMDRKRLTSDNQLGQADLKVDELCDGKPHYLWIQLEGQSGANTAAGGPGTELHVRTRWTKDVADDADNSSHGLSSELFLHGIGISFVEASIVKLSREVMYLLLEDIHVSVNNLTSTRSGLFSVKSVQIDNQLLSSTHPVVLARTVNTNRHATPETLMHDAAQTLHPKRQARQRYQQALQLQRPFVEIHWEMLQHNPSILYFKHFALSIQEMDLVIEEDFLDIISSMIRELPYSDIYQHDAPQTSQSFLSKEDPLQELLDPTAAMTSQSKSRLGRKWYFEKLDLRAVRCNLSLIPRPGFHEVDVGSNSNRYRLATALGIHFINITDVPLRLSALQLKNAFVSPQSLLAQLLRHLVYQAIGEMHKILGQVALLGTPIAFGSNILAGLASFFAEPAKARNPEEFVRGVLRGSGILLKYATFGFFNAFSQVSGSVGKGLAIMSMDQEYVNRFHQQPLTYQQRLLQGLQAAGVGSYEGVIGVVKLPIDGWQDNGLLGLVEGIAKGAAGLLLKPPSGVLECFSKTISGLAIGIRTWGDEAVRLPRTRIRSPRHFAAFADDSGELVEFQQWQTTLQRADKGRYASDKVVDYLRNKSDKALIITEHHIVYMNTKRKQVRWAFSISHLTHVSSHRLVVYLHHSLALAVWPVPADHSLRLPARKRVECRSRDLHQSLLVKLNQARAQHNGPDTSSSPAARKSALEAGGAHDLQIMHRRPPVRKTTWGSLRLRLPDRVSSMGDDSAAFSRPSTDGADSLASSTADHPSTEPSDLHPSQYPHASMPFSNSSAIHQSSTNFPDTGLGQQPNSPRENHFSRPSRGFRRQLTGPRSSAAGNLEAASDGPPPVHELSRSSAYPMQPPPRMASIPESPRAALPSAEELRQSNLSANPQPSLYKPSVGFIQQPGPGRGAGFARASAPARAPHGGPAPPSPWSTQHGAPDLHGQAGSVQHAAAHPPPIRTHGPPPAVSSYGTDPPMATVSLVTAPGNSSIRAGPLGSPSMSSTPLSQPAFSALHGRAGAGQFAQQPPQGPLGGPNAAGTRPVQFQAAEAEKPGKGSKGEAGPSSAGASRSSSSEHLRAIGLLCQAAAITGTSSNLSNQHLRSMRMLCQAYLSDPGRAHGDGRAVVESIQSLIDTQPGGREPLFTTIGLLASSAESL